jgi:hypothetical protein
MANPFGAGAALVIPLPTRAASPAAVDETSTVRVREPKTAAAPASASSSAPSAGDSPAVTELLDRLVAALRENTDGLTAAELRLSLSAKPDVLQRALAAGLRARRLRRSGSRCRLRYILNG